MSGVAWGSSIQFNLAKKLAFLLQFSLVSFFGHAGIHGLVMAVMKTDSMDSDRFGLRKI